MLREIADAILTAGETEGRLPDRDGFRVQGLFGRDRDRRIRAWQRACFRCRTRFTAYSEPCLTWVPVICVVNGPAIGGGTELALFGDLVVATPKARFAQPEITIGVFPPLASTILPFLVGPKVAMEIILTGEPITAERALDLGLINRLVTEAELEKTVGDLVGRITAHSGPVLSMAKKAILGGMGMSLREGLKQSMDIFLNQLYKLEDSQEGLRALVEKRKPNWKNR